jgi:hypothetical protein
MPDIALDSGGGVVLPERANVPAVVDVAGRGVVAVALLLLQAARMTSAAVARPATAKRVWTGVMKKLSILGENEGRKQVSGPTAVTRCTR